MVKKANIATQVMLFKFKNKSILKFNNRQIHTKYEK